MSADTSKSAPVDEAGESPRWLPVAGIIIFVLGAAWLAVGDSVSDDEAALEVVVDEAVLVE